MVNWLYFDKLLNIDAGDWFRLSPIRTIETPSDPFADELNKKKRDAVQSNIVFAFAPSLKRFRALKIEFSLMDIIFEKLLFIVT